MATKQYDKLIKLLLIGDSSVGKSSIMYRFSNNEFTHSYITTIGIDFKVKTIEIDGKKIKLQIWDTAGQERYHTITRNYYRSAMGVMLVYDITKAKTFDNISRWLEKIEQEAPEGVAKMLIGNKCDMVEQRQISQECGEQIAIKHGISFFETSAKTNTNIEMAFHYMTGAVLNMPPQNKKSANTFELHINREKQLGCC